MTTAARPTWAPAKGGNEQGGTRIFGPSQKYSSRDLAAHTSLKPRKEGQQTQEELQKRNLREELEERERKHYSSKDKSYAEERDRRKSSSQLLLEATTYSVLAVTHSDEDEDDDDDDTEALMAELERIKKERAEEKLRKERQQAEEEAKMKEAELMRGNPLININNPGSFSVKRRQDADVSFLCYRNPQAASGGPNNLALTCVVCRWDDDVVFKNQARGESKTPKRFINDTIRSDFHRKFLQRYMK
ncbi:hypothetical protein C2845_PM01G34310 [Panicum miliaceum]|uniref:Uncharacterized protein n=1 Tax=Panicum miliaceum TaxID=4540 RepID=A0A3L6TJ78_PANMI|nr:hypothetical protein C2845_PM01G34310 [Panicum miliaceum]